MHRLRIPDEVAGLVRHMHPLLKAAIRTSLAAIIRDPHCGKALRDELEGLRSLRVKRFRIIYRLSSDEHIDIVAIGPRRSIYEETFRMIGKDQNPKN